MASSEGLTIHIISDDPNIDTVNKEDRVHGMLVG